MLHFKIAYLVLFATFVSAYFSPTQLEILDLHYKIQPKNGGGKEVRSFYSVLSVPPNVKEDKLEKAYKKLSRKWHPDKFIRADAKERRKAERKFETLSLIISILRDVERRKNYDYFLKRGFPVWDESKARYVFKNRSKPTFKIVLAIVLILTTIGQLIVSKLNKSQKNKRIEQILRDVRWKADNMTRQDQNTNKIMELPDDYEMTNGIETPIYSVDDRLVTYCGKVFIVKPDRSVLLYNNENFNVEDQQEMNDLVKKIVESGHFNLYGFQKKPMNRKERRHVEKEKKKSDDADIDSDIVEHLVQFREDESGFQITDLFVVKLVFGVWNLTVGKIFSGAPALDKIDKAEENHTKDQANDEDAQSYDIIDLKKENDGNIILPNGKVLHSRKK